MEIQVTQTLKDLSQVFARHGAPLYIVGGFVRNALLGFCETDVDICSFLKAEEVKEILDPTMFSAAIVNRELGTLLIKSKLNSEEFEYTAWRAEQYETGGKHSPKEVEFVRDIKQDAARRDFTANCLYYEIKTGKIIDLYNGMEDVAAHVLRTVETPDYVFSRDGLRILRLVRMSCELDFSIDEECFDVAKKLVSQLKDISHERFNKEIISILFSDYKYNGIVNPHAPVMGIKLLSELGAWQYVFPVLSKNMGGDKLNTLLSGNFLDAFAGVLPVNRVTAFTFDVLTALKLEFTPENVTGILGVNGLMLPAKEAELNTRILQSIKKILKNDFEYDEKRLFVQSNHDIIPKLIDLAQSLGIKTDIGVMHDLMIIDNVPMTLRELEINGNDIAEAFPNKNKRDYGRILKELLNRCCLFPELNDKKRLLEIVKDL